MNQSPYEATVLPFRMICGDGEDEETTTRTTETQTNDDGSSKTTETEPKPKEGEDLESQLDQERAARIQLQRERDDAAEATQVALRENQEEGDRVAAERDDYKKKYEKLKGLMETSYLTNAIAQQEKFDFHDAEAVRTFLNAKSIRLDLDTGKIDGLDVELRRIAKEKPYLVKQNEETTPGGGFTPPPGNTGSHPRGGQTRQPVTDKNKLGQKYKMPGFSGVLANKF